MGFPKDENHQVIVMKLEIIPLLLKSSTNNKSGTATSEIQMHSSWQRVTGKLTCFASPGWIWNLSLNETLSRYSNNWLETDKLFIHDLQGFTRKPAEQNDFQYFYKDTIVLQDKIVILRPQSRHQRM